MPRRKARPRARPAQLAGPALLNAAVKVQVGPDNGAHSTCGPWEEEEARALARLWRVHREQLLALGIEDESSHWAIQVLDRGNPPPSPPPDYRLVHLDEGERHEAEEKWAACRESLAAIARDEIADE